MLAFTAHTERRPARGQQAGEGTAANRSATNGAASSKVFELSGTSGVGRSVARRARAGRVTRRAVGQAKRLGDGRRDERRLAKRGERDEPHANQSLFRNRAGEFQPEAGLADTARTNEGDEARDRIGEPRPQRLHVRITPDEDRQRQRHGRLGPFVSDRKACRSRAPEKCIARPPREIERRR